MFHFKCNIEAADRHMQTHRGRMCIISNVLILKKVWESCHSVTNKSDIWTNGTKYKKQKDKQRDIQSHAKRKVDKEAS